MRHVKSLNKLEFGRMLTSCVAPDLFWSTRGILSATSNGILRVPDDTSNLLRLKKKKLHCLISSSRDELSSVCCKTPPTNLLGGFRLLGSRGDVRPRVRTQAKPKTGENEGGEGDKDVQGILVELLRLETGKVRVDEFVEERSKFLTDIAEQANEEFDRIAEEAKKSLDEAGSKVLEQIDAEAADFEEELAAARAEMEANEREFDQFEKSVEQARSEGLFFKSLYSKTKPWKAKTPEEQREIKEKAQVVTDALTQGTKKAAGSKLRRAAYGVMIILLTLTVLEAISSGDVQWTRLIVYILVLVALVVQLSYETLVSRDNKDNDNK